MELPFIQGAGQAPDIDTVLTVALYDAESGRIVHQHAAVVFAGGRAIPEAEAIEAARTSAAGVGHRTRELKVAVSDNPDALRGPHRIDTGTGAFVRLPLAEPAERGPASAT
ncbi:hypothetical protein [Nocardia sp. CS682]|uniref:hypothetical protein n=1 Tax=Nocardia sp. CS682 TaxID=1047172 RepID=UPI001074A7E4|nr:hypothetical protein [Nocardia sp. CS682]QBS44198.1 hypothetical protein DMB37_33005 [Nocardia sp. CS682]